ncbi:MAG: GTPase Era [Elusimicrobiota bacterium]|nr:GTPase Era [Endomicrobiia bacterium]MDW8165459.1 GTPase Era [Elusimicrobiota bacterium]
MKETIQNNNSNFKAGYVAIIGKPNVGKSTLLNTILGEKVAIVSSVAGTTRFSITGIKNLPNAQIIFFDTPGIYEPKNELEKRMYSYAYNSILDADVILFLINAKEGFIEYDYKILNKFREILNENKIEFEKVNLLCILNKIDLIKNTLEIEEKIKNIKNEFPFFKEIIPISALNNTNIDLLLEKIIKYLPYNQKLFEDEEAFKLPLKLQISEIIREKIFQNVYQEVPKSTAVVIEEIRPGDVDKNKIIIEAYIIVEKENHKAIIIGENGKKLKLIGTQARIEIEKLLNKPVFLSLHVKLKEKWTKKTDFLSQLGF